jgi:hypothetical protein
VRSLPRAWPGHRQPACTAIQVANDDAPLQQRQLSWVVGGRSRQVPGGGGGRATGRCRVVYRLLIGRPPGWSFQSGRESGRRIAQGGLNLRLRQALRVGQVRPAELRAGQVRPAELRVGQVRLVELRAGQVRLAELRAGQVRSVEPRAGQVRLVEPRVGQVRPLEPRAGQVRPAELRAGQVRLIEHRVGEMQIAQVQHAPGFQVTATVVTERGQGRLYVRRRLGREGLIGSD